ncbi:hypothetical protein CB1_056579045 [Camelus ferus]|nr:hypothetical protein CB1_056579045 [Camelus ferus]
MHLRVPVLSLRSLTESTPLMCWNSHDFATMCTSGEHSQVSGDRVGRDAYAKPGPGDLLWSLGLMSLVTTPWDLTKYDDTPKLPKPL